MKWASQKSSSLITRVFSKFKRNSSSKNSKNNKSTVLDFPSPKSSFHREGRFYSMNEDDAYWRISFGGNDRIQPRRSTGGVNPCWQDSDNDVENHMFSGFERLGLAEAEVPRRNFSEMVSDIKRMRESRGKQKVKDERERRVDIESKDSRKPRFAEECCENRRLRDIKVKTKPKSEADVIRRKGKVRAVKSCSPRTECKIRALEEIRKARTQAKKKDPIFDSFAVVKSSLDPHRDFKDSMVEMIREKEIGHPDDLEDLLASYLTLNCDEYHDLIITVFRQVWLELKETCVDPFMKECVVF